MKFNYLYRNANNYKAWGEVVFENPEGLSLEEEETRLRKAFYIEGTFVAHQVHIPEVFLYADGSLTEADHCFHEFSSVEFTEDHPTDIDGRSIKDIRGTSRVGGGARVESLPSSRESAANEKAA